MPLPFAAEQFEHTDFGENGFEIDIANTEMHENFVLLQKMLQERMLQ